MQRLKRPAIGAITNCFNDATSVLTYHAIYGDFGHDGIDFGSEPNDPVVAMYRGEVVESRNNWSTGQGTRGNYVTIRSCTNAEQDSGFEHRYLHLSSVDVSPGQYVKKGQKIGAVGKTGVLAEHLHVDLAPFDSAGRIAPATEDSSDSGKLVPDEREWALGDLLEPPVRVNAG